MVPLRLQHSRMLAVLREQVQSVQARDPRPLRNVSLRSLPGSMMTNPAFNRKSSNLLPVVVAQLRKCQ